MKFTHYALTRTLSLVLVILFAATLLTAQVQQPLTWQQDLTYLENASGDLEGQRMTLEYIRSQVDSWLKVHPDAKVTLNPAPPKPWNAELIRTEITSLRETVQAIVNANPAQAFHLGVTSVDVASTVPAISPLATSIGQNEIELHQAVTVAMALDYIPGVEIQHLAGNRNEKGFMIRGFSSNGQVPLYLDGIPIYVPYDGYLDLARFLTSDIAEIQVAKGFSSALQGPNALGGSVNLVTREPVKKYEAETLIGGASGAGLLAGVHLGTRREKWFAQTSLDWLQQDYMPLSGNFLYAPGGYVNLTKSGNVPYSLVGHENNSATRDEKYSGRLGWTPRKQDEYVFSYINQKGEKSDPLYQGSNPNASFKNFWEWPYWNKNSYYFLSNTGVGEQSSLKTRVFYDQFRNGINMYDNSTYSTMNSYTATSGSGSEYSRYDDHSDGFSTEFTTRLLPRNVIGTSIFFKDDTHREYGIYPGANLFTPEKVLRDQILSVGIQDSINLTARLKAIAGFSADYLDGLQTETYNGYVKGEPPANTLVIPYKCAASPTNASFSGCTAHFWNNNPQAAVTYRLTEADSLFATFADRGRFPTLKQRYSSGMGSALPNPDLQPEKSRNFNLGYSHLFPHRTFLQVELFRSDLRNAIESGLIPDPGATTIRLCPNNTAASPSCSQNINIGKETHEGVEVTIRSTPISRLTVDLTYAYLNRIIGSAVLPTGTSLSGVLVLPTGLPKNDAKGTITLRLPHQILALASAKYQGGIVLQDTTYASTSPSYQPYAEAFTTLDFAAIVPIKHGVTWEAGIKNALDRNYFYNAGYPEEGRNWYTNLRYRF